MSNKTDKTPIIIVTSDRWSRDPYIVFEGDELIGYAIANDWINDRLLNSCEYDPEITQEKIEKLLVFEFKSENDGVDEFWPERMICRAGDNYYRYDSAGMVKWLGNYDSIDELEE